VKIVYFMIIALFVMSCSPLYLDTHNSSTYIPNQNELDFLEMEYPNINIDNILASSFLVDSTPSKRLGEYNYIENVIYIDSEYNSTGAIFIHEVAHYIQIEYYGISPLRREYLEQYANEIVNEYCLFCCGLLF